MPYSCFHKQYVNTLSRVLIKRAVATGVTDSNIVESDGADIITKQANCWRLSATLWIKLYELV